MKKVFKSKKFVVFLAIIIVVILAIVLLSVVGKSKSVYGDRCSDNANYKLSNDTINNAKDTIKTIGNVDEIDIYTKLCTVKIIVTLSDDVDLNKVKDMSKDLLKAFDEKDLKYYDFALYVDVEGKDSETYPVSVSKHNSKDEFAW